MTVDASRLLALWAKTAKTAETAETADAAGGPGWHPLAYHLLDVAAVAEALLARSRFPSDFAAARGVERTALARFVLLLVGLHDIGKCSLHFQFRLPEAQARLAEAGFGNPCLAPPERHGAITAAYLTRMRNGDRPVAAVFERFAPRLLGGAHAAKIVGPVAGHHGRPVDAARIDGRIARANAPFVAAAAELAEELARIFEVTALPDRWLERDRDAAALSWFLSALIPVADWIGSNQTWFPPCAPDRDLSTYWECVARPAAARALVESGLSPIAIARPDAARTLPGIVAPTPLQEHLLHCPLPAGPALFVIEDATGSGKTEAALTLAHRLMDAGRADGFYFALPTTATADAMYARLATGFDLLFDATPDVAPSLARVHGRAGRRVAPDDDAPVAAFCAEWIADDRRKAFMAQGGAGTIDQALLTILPAKYQSLRLFGLHGKVLIVDELHSFDDFVLRELTALVELHAMLGGSTILMSATLHIATREKLTQAHERGRGRTLSSLSSHRWPLLTTVCDSGADEKHIALASQSRRRVAVERIDTVADAERGVVEAAEHGAAVALIRSTVDAAIESFARLRERLGERVELLHSRFLPEDRARIETTMLRRFGRDSRPDDRHGRVLVATQVIEQSLDVDFDALYADLAPIDLLIQRAGRLWRHARERRVVRAPVLRVIAPRPGDGAEADWLDATLKESAWVYRDTARLWLSARRVFEAGEIVVGTYEEGNARRAHVRSLVDAVYGAGADMLPTPSLRDRLGKSAGQSYAKASLAGSAVLEPSNGYCLYGRNWEAENVVRTRLEEPRRVVLRLARAECDTIVPLAKDGWTRSEISVTEHWALDLREPNESERARLRPAWAEADSGLRLLTIGAAADQGRDAAVTYDGVIGLARGARRSKLA